MYEHAKIDKLCEMKEKLVEFVGSHISDEGLSMLDTRELGEAIDMIKDLADAEKNCWEACYYKSVVEAMDEYSENPRMGYNPNRNAMGQYSDGRGRAGYVPMYMDWDWDEGNERIGYDQKGRGTRSPSGSRMGYEPGDMYTRMMDDDMDEKSRRYARTYNGFRKAKRHYTQSHSEEDKKQMNDHAVAHMNDAMETMKDIWETADPNLRRKMKEDLTKFANDLSA